MSAASGSEFVKLRSEQAAEPVQEALEVLVTVAVPVSVPAAFRQLLARVMGFDRLGQPGALLQKSGRPVCVWRGKLPR